jgi:hypothetical protein
MATSSVESWTSDCEEKTVCVLLYSDIWSVGFSETVIVPVLKSATR